MRIHPSHRTVVRRRIAGQLPPSAPLVDARKLDAAGRRFVETPTAGLASSPIRVYAGLHTAPTPQQRVDLAVRELERQGGFSRSRILVVSPTGGGHVNPIMIEGEERLSLGDIASVSVQYAALPSALAFHKVGIAAETHALLLAAIRRRIDELYPNGGGPRVMIYGESLGAWASQRALRQAGPAGAARYGIDRALWVGVPGFSSVPAESVGGQAVAVTSRGQLALAQARMGTALRFVSFSHVDDPVHVASLALLYRPPRARQLGAAGPADARSGAGWLPVVSFINALVDVAVSAGTERPGLFGDSGHDYRGDLPEVLRTVFGHEDVSDQQLARITGQLRASEQTIMSRHW